MYSLTDKKPFFVLAPMDDVTDTVFRQVIAGTAKPDLYFTEFVNVDGMQSTGREKVIPKLKYSDKETPIVAQLWGKTPENYYKTAKDIETKYFSRTVNSTIDKKRILLGNYDSLPFGCEE
jgi:tRNA-dihydrouridine synthase